MKYDIYRVFILSKKEQFSSSLVTLGKWSLSDLVLVVGKLGNREERSRGKGMKRRRRDVT